MLKNDPQCIILEFPLILSPWPHIWFWLSNSRNSSPRLHYGNDLFIYSVKQFTITSAYNMLMLLGKTGRKNTCASYFRELVKLLIIYSNSIHSKCDYQSYHTNLFEAVIRVFSLAIELQYESYHTLQEKHFYWNQSFAFSLMANSLNLNSDYCKVFEFSRWWQIHFRNRNSVIFEAVNFSNLSPVA